MQSRVIVYVRKEHRETVLLVNVLISPSLVFLVSVYVEGASYADDLVEP